MGDLAPTANQPTLPTQGLVVPVLRNVETMNYADIEKGVNELGTKVRVPWE